MGEQIIKQYEAGTITFAEAERYIVMHHPEWHLELVMAQLLMEG